MNSSRRDFIKRATATGAAIFASPAMLHHAISPRKEKLVDADAPFRLRYAPGFGMFPEHAGRVITDDISFCSDQGFRAMFDNGLMKRPAPEQSEIADGLNRRGMTLGPFVLHADFSVPSFVRGDNVTREMLINRMKEGVEVAKRTGAKWGLVVPGRYDERLHRDFQTANIVDNLRYCCDVVEPAGLTIVIEPLNTLISHPGLFLTGIPQAYSICRSVNRSSCKIVNDLYHQQVTEGNLIPNIEAAWSEIASFHCGDNPGRNEPGTGEINFRNIFRFLHAKQYDGVICMEHGKSLPGKEGEIRLIKAYREADSFEI